MNQSIHSEENARTVFNEHAAEYQQELAVSLGHLGGDLSGYPDYKAGVMHRYLGCKPKRILEYGCGIGLNVPALQARFPSSEIWGCDISEDSLRLAAEGNPQGHFFQIDPARNTELSDSFDVLLMACVLHHVPVEHHSVVIEKAAAYLRPGADLFIFEHNPRNPVTRYIVQRCPFDEGVTLLDARETVARVEESGLDAIRKKYVLFFPPSWKWLRLLDSRLGQLPLGGQYFVQARRSGVA